MYSSPTITYYFRSTTRADITLAEKGLLPKDYFYFYHFLDRYFPLSSVSTYISPMNPAISILNDRFLHFFLGFDFPLLSTFLTFRQPKRSEIIFATTPKLGLSLAFLKKLGLIKCKLIINICGLYDQLENTSNFTRRFCRYILMSVDLFISNISWHEAFMLSRLLKLPLNKFVFAPYSGIDTKYFSKGKKWSIKDFVLGIGVDPSRDWDLYRQVAIKLPQENFVWATNPKLVGEPIPSNVVVEYFSTPELREKMRQAKLVLILTKNNQHFSGQASAFRAMSCGKAVILTKTPGIEEFPLRHLENCLLVEPKQGTQVVKYINKLTQNPNLTRQIGKNASLLIQSKYCYRKIGNKYLQLFKRVL